MMAVAYFQNNIYTLLHLQSPVVVTILIIVTMPQFNVNNLNFLNWDYPAIYEVIIETWEYSDILNLFCRFLSVKQTGRS